jgi:multidrug efflux pump subunit AcrB
MTPARKEGHAAPERLHSDAESRGPATLASFAVHRWQFTIVLFVMLALLGVNSWFAIPRAEDPTFPAPVYTVIAVYPGAPPSDIEQLVVEPIEERIGELDDVKEIRTKVENEFASITVEFDIKVDAKKKKDEVLREINALRPDLPADLYSLDVRGGDATNVNIVQIALVSGSAPYHVLQDLAEKVEDRFEIVAGVKGAETWGFPEREVRVSLDLGRLAQLGLPVSRVLAAIGSEGANLPGGSIEIGKRKLNLKGSGNYTEIEDIRNTVVGGAAGDIVRLRDVASVEWDYEDHTHLARYNGKRAIFVTATQKDGYNITKIRDGIYAELDALEPTLPASVTLERGFDQAKNVSHRLSRLTEDFAIAIALVLITLIPLGFRSSAIVMISIPLSLAIAITMLRFTGFGINQLSIVGFVIALGLLVDDSIVVVENIARFLREGHSRAQAAVLATKQISVAVVGATATLIFAFVPLLFLPGMSGRYIRVMPVAVVSTVLASLFVSLTIIPWLASMLLKEEEPGGSRAWRAFVGAIHATYRPLLHRALAYPGRTLAIAVALFLGSLALVPVVGFSLFPKAGTPQFLVDIRAPEGASITETNAAATFAERALMGRPDVKAIFTNVGHPNPQVYYNVFSREEKANIGQLFVLLEKKSPKAMEPMLDSLRAHYAQYPGVRIEVREFENGPPIDAPVAMRVSGEDLDTLRTLARQVELAMLATPGTQYVDNPVRLSRTDIQLALDRQKAGMLGIATVEVDRTVRLGVAGVRAGHIREADGDEHDIAVRLPHGGAPGVESLDRIYLASMTGAQVPLRQIAQPHFSASPTVIEHHDQQRSVTVKSWVRSGYNTDRVTKDVLRKLDDVELPQGYRLTPAGELESRQESFGGIGSAVIVAVFAILAILVLEFKTFKSMLIVASVIPLGVVGGIGALLLTGYTLSFTATIGFVALIGIEIKTSILLVDFTNQLRKEGVPIDEAIERAGEVRFVPILLTTMTAIGGLLPLALQNSSLYSPLAWVIIGGLVSSTLLARLVTPVMYKLLAPSVA